MRTEAHISFNGKDIPGGIDAFLAAMHCGSGEAVLDYVEILRRLCVNITVPEGDERILKIVAQLEKYGVDFHVAYFDRYTDEELDSAPLLFLDPNFQCEVDGGSEFGTTYDLTSACPKCGAGARQTSAMFLDGDTDQLPNLEGHRAAYTYRNEIVIDDRIAAEIEALAPTGLLLHQVYALMPNKRQVKLPWKHLSATHVLPPMSPLTRGIERPYPCPLCPRSGYWDVVPTPRLVYRKQDLEGMADVNLTWEEMYEGFLPENPREWMVPVPWLLVTPRVMHIFRAAGITELEWFPIRVVEE